MYSLNDLYLIVPELFLLGSVLAILIWCLFQPASVEQSSTRLVRLSIIVLGGTLALILFSVFPKSIFFHGMLETNTLTRFFKIGLLLTAITVFSASPISWAFRRQFAYEYPLLLLLSLLGGMVSFSANDFLVLFLGLELQTLPLYILVTFHKHSPLSSEAGLKYFTLGALATGFFLFGVSLIYGALGTIHFQTFQNLLSLFAENPGGLQQLPSHFLVGMVFVLGAFFFKLSLAPFHMWAPDVYEGTATPTTFFLATCVKIVALGVLVRLFWGPLAPIKLLFEDGLSLVAGLSMLIGAFGGIFQSNFKRLLAYSGISHMGYLLSAIVAGGSSGLQALFLYLMIYIPMILVAFILLMLLRKGDEHTGPHLSDFKGLAKASPMFALLMAALMFSLAGIPPLGGFFGKFAILMALIENHLIGLAIVAVISSVLSCYYYLRIIKLMYFENVQEGHASLSKIKWDLSFNNRLILMGLLLLIFGFSVFIPFLAVPLENLG